VRRTFILVAPLRSHQTAQATILTLVYKMKIRALLGRPCELTAGAEILASPVAKKHAWSELSSSTGRCSTFLPILAVPTRISSSSGCARAYLRACMSDLEAEVRK
jgi:hypothetical protein